MFWKDYKMWRVIEQYGDNPTAPFPSYACICSVHSTLQNMPEIPVNTKVLNGVHHTFHHKTQADLINRVNAIVMDMAERTYSVDSYAGANRLVLGWATAGDTFNPLEVYKSIDYLISSISNHYPNRDQHLDRLLQPVARDCVEYLRMLRRSNAA